MTPLNSCGHRVTWPVLWALHYIWCPQGAGLGISSCGTQTNREQALELFLRIDSDIASWMGTIAGNTISTRHLGDPESISVTGESHTHPFTFTERSTTAWGSQEWISRSRIHQSTNTFFSPIFFSYSPRSLIGQKWRVEFWVLGWFACLIKSLLLGLPLCISLNKESFE